MPEKIQLTSVLNPLPITRRSIGDCYIGSSPDLESSLPQTFPRFYLSGKPRGMLLITVAGPRRHVTELPY